MTDPQAETGPGGRPGGVGPDAASRFDRALAELDFTADEPPFARAAASAATATTADAVGIWLCGRDGRPGRAVALHARRDGRPDVLPEPPAGAVERRLAALAGPVATLLAADGSSAVHRALLERIARPSTDVGVLDAAIPGERTPQGLVSIARTHRTVWTPAERAFAAALAQGLGAALLRAELRSLRARSAELDRRVVALQRNDTLARVARGIAHDVNNALTAALGYVQLLGEGAPARSYAPPALTTIRHASSLLQQLLALGRSPPSDAPLADVDRVIGDLAGILSALVGDRIALTTEHAAGSPAVAIDPARLEQIVLNLVVNARDAIQGHGRITLSTRADAGTDHVVLRVADDGTGIDEATLARVFEPYFTTRPGGTGLGLSTVQDIVAACGGRIECRSAPGAGSTFDVWLPRAGP
jgi:signal transduction histidine kinase